MLAGGSSSTFVRSVKGVYEGTATITAKVKGDNSKSASCVVKVYNVAASDIKFACEKADSAYISGDVVTLLPMQSITLTPIVLPETASFRTVTWASDDETVATANERGKITALSVGTTAITVTDYLGMVTKTLTVNVNSIPVEDLKVFVPASFKALEGETDYDISRAYAIRPAIASNTNVVVTSSDLNVVRVVNQDTIHTVAPGTATITITTEDGGKTGSFEVTVVRTEIGGFKLDVDTIRLNVGNKFNIPYTFTPANATDKQIVSSSSDPTVVEIIDGNVVRALKAGKSVVTISAGEGKYEDSVVVLVQVAVQSITCNEAVKTLNVGEEYDIAYTILPSDATNKNLTVSIADNSILELLSGTKVKALQKGKTVVTLTTEDGNQSDDIIIKVE